MSERTWESPPSVPWLSLALKRGRGLRDGDDLPRLDSVITRASGDLDAYARVCGLPRGEAMPLCWPHVLAGPLHLRMLADPAFPLPGLGMVHVANHILQRRPLRADEPLTLRCAWEGWTRVKHGVELTLSTRVEAGGEIPWEGRSLYLSRASPGAGEASREDPPALPGVARSTHWRLGADLGRRYAAVSGDYNLIHIHPIPAKLFGFSRTIIHGMWTLARAVGELDPAPGAWALDVVFRRPIQLPSAVLFESSSTGEFQVRRPRDGKPHLHGGLRPL